MRHITSMPGLLLIFLIVSGSIAAEDKTIDTQHSTITVHVGKGGVFSAAGHEHWVNAPIASGSFNDSDSLRIEFRVETAKMELKVDSKDDGEHQKEIQQTMQEKVLESSKYPQITFRSSSVDKAGDGEWTVRGNLTLHGVTKPIVVSVKREASVYSGRAVIKQTDFGIKPMSVGGVVKVKDELGITFRIVSN